MSTVSITSCESRINSPTLAHDFERVFRPYRQLAEKAASSVISASNLRIVYVMFCFDPLIKNGEHGVKVDKYSKKSGEAEVVADVYLDECALLEKDDFLALIAGRLLAALRLLETRVMPAAIPELNAIVHSLLDLNRSLISDYDSRVERLLPEFSADAPAPSPEANDASAGEENAETPFCLVLQFRAADFTGPEELYSFEEKLMDTSDATVEWESNDLGNGKLNIFMACVDPHKAATKCKRLLKQFGLLDRVTLACVRRGEDNYTLVWPKAEHAAFELY